MKLTCSIIFPNQLFKESPLLKKNSEVFLVEEFLFFKQYNFHKQKILFHRSSMKYYNEYLSNMGVKVNYIDSYNDLSDIRNLIIELSKKGFKEIEYIDSVDYLLERRINKFAIENKIKLIKHDSLLFINDQEDLNSFFKPEK
jgi:deoxyribodipyrimidine photolyase-related protein